MKSSSKKCNECLEVKELTEFYTKGQSATGSHYWEPSCKVCSRIRSNNRQKGKVFTSEQKKKKSISSSAWAKRTRSNPDTRHVILWKEYRNVDRKRDMENDLSKEIIEEMIRHPCCYCGEDGTNMTLDRIDNGLGHCVGNVNTSCLRCNLVRGDMPYDAWMNIAPVMKETRTKGLFAGWQPKRRN